MPAWLLALLAALPQLLQDIPQLVAFIEAIIAIFQQPTLPPAAFSMGKLSKDEILAILNGLKATALAQA